MKPTLQGSMHSAHMWSSENSHSTVSLKVQRKSSNGQGFLEIICWDCTFCPNAAMVQNSGYTEGRVMGVSWGIPREYPNAESDGSRWEYHSVLVHCHIRFGPVFRSGPSEVTDRICRRPVATLFNLRTRGCLSWRHAADMGMVGTKIPSPSNLARGDRTPQLPLILWEQRLYL